MAASLGEFETLILLAVLRLGDRAVPPEIRAEIERRTRRSVARGAVYVTLDRLESKRHLSSRLAADAAAESTRPRRFYAVAPKGMRALRRALNDMQQMRAGLEQVLDVS